MLLITFTASGAIFAAPLSENEIVQISKSAFIWGYPIVDNYSVLYSQALDPSSPGYRAPINQIAHAQNVATPQDKSIVSPNVDTPYSYAWLDVANEPIVLTLPKVQQKRYIAIQLIDAYTYIIDYIKPSTTSATNYLIVGPNWKGKSPENITKIIKTDTNIALALYRTELLNTSDIKEVHNLQNQYLVRTLSTFESKPALKKLSLPPLVAPIDIRKNPTNLEFFNALNWMLASMPVLPEEKNLREQFKKIGIGAGRKFLPKGDKEQRAIIEGMQLGLQEMVARAMKIKSSSELFGSRAFLGNDYLTRAVAAMIGIYGNAEQEFLSVGYASDSDNKPFNGGRMYKVTFKDNQLPPVDGFWSITAYGADRFLYPNELNRYKLSSHMLPEFVRDKDGAITFYIQHSPPGEDRDKNWLPVPDGPFILTFRTYLPKLPIRDGQWVAPPVVPY